MNSCERHYQRARHDLSEAQAARAHAEPAPQPEESTATSESPGSIRTSPESAAAADSKLPPNPPKAAPAPAQSSGPLANRPIEPDTAAAAVPSEADFANVR
jgi:hypothetical protein